jgi:PAS domain S-box-containing protein
MEKLPALELNLLRQKAEELLRNTPVESTTLLSEADTLRLIHELEVHQEELRMQNEELKFAKEQADYAAEKYEEIYNFAASNQYTLSREGNILELNLAGSQLLGKKHDQVLNSKFISFISEDSRSGFILFLNQLFNGEEKNNCKVFFALNNGVSLYVLLTGVANPKRDRCFVTATDITEINQAEIAGRKNDERYRTLVSNIPAVTFVLNEVGIFTLSEGKGLAKLGLQPGEVVGMSALDFYHDYPSIIDLIRNAYDGISGRKEISIQGNVFDVFTTPVFDKQGSVIEVIGVANDITERKHAEEAVRETNSKLELAMQLAEMAWWEMDAVTGAATFEKRKVEMLGYQPENFKHYKDFMALVHPGDYENTMNAMRSHFDGKSDRYETEYRILTASGEYKWFYDLGSIVNRDSTGKPLTVAGLAMNITDRKNAEEEIRSAHSRLKHFFDSDLIGIVIADVSGRLIETNDYYLNMIGFSRADYEAGMVDWRKITPPEWLYVDEQAIRELREKGKCTPYEKEYIRKDGSRIVILITDALLPGPDEHIVGFILDITERKQAEKALQESELKYRELIENSPDAIVIYSKGEIILANKESLRLMSVDNAEELLGKQVLQFVHPDGHKLVKERMKKMSDDNMVLPLSEERFVRPDGSEVVVEVKAMPIRFENKKAVQLIIRDITQRKKDEKSLRESEDRNKALIEANPDMMFLFDENEVFIDFHSPFHESLYTPASNFAGKKISDILPPDVALITSSKLKEVFRTGEPEIYNYQLVINDKLRDYESRLVKCGNSEALSIVRDITDTKNAEAKLLASEAKFRELFETNTDGITIFNNNADGPPSLILDMNENAAKMVGYTKEELLLINPNNIEKNITKEKMDKRRNDLLSKGFSDFETIILHKDGHEIDVEIKVMMIKYNNQPALMNIVRDITERKNSEMQLQKYAIALSKQIAEKDKFFSIIAHDLRGPFNGFLELSNLMAEESFNIPMDDMRKMAAAMKKSATNLFRLLGNLLEWSRMQRGITTYNPTPIFLNPKIGEITGLAQETALKKGIEIRYNIPAEMVVFADENMLEGILRNLTANAVKYTNAGGSIIVSAKYIAGDNVEFSIKDTGIGMSPAILDNLFNIDVNTNRKGTAGELSTGLGLIICKDFIEKHNSKLRIESEQGKGSTFKFTIPGHITSADGIDSAISLRVETRSDQAGKLSILIAEDEETSDLLISISLNKISKEIFHAKTGIEAVNICRSHPGIELIMMDIQMPETDGYEATRRIRQFNKEVIIIAQTAYAFANDRETAKQAGCNDYISKPISQAELMEVIRKHCK